MLLERGFKVVSDAVALRRDRTNADASWTDGSARAALDTASVVEYKSSYIVQVRYTYRNWDRWLLNFNASLVHLQTGDVVVSAEFSGYKHPRTVLRQFVSSLQVQGGG